MSWFKKLFGSDNKILLWQQAQQQQQADQAALQQQALTKQIADQQAAATAILHLPRRRRLRRKRAAQEANYRASLTPADSEDARTASEQRMKRLLGKRGVNALFGGAGASTGAAPVRTIS